MAPLRIELTQCGGRGISWQRAAPARDVVLWSLRPASDGMFLEEVHSQSLKEEVQHVSRGKWFTLPVLIGFAAPACSFDNGPSKAAHTLDDASIVECTNECPKIEGGDIGADGVTLEVDGETVTFVSWQEKEDDGGYIGFTLDVSASFIVKAGNTCYAGEGTSWTHPAGTSGPEASAISNVQICSVGEPESFCGDGTVDEGEECDDGNHDDGDGCSANCTLEMGPGSFCGDGTLDGGEQCDDGNNVDGDGCSANCTLESSFCGDGTVDEGEECDDGNNDDGDGCSGYCLLEMGRKVCGDGTVDEGEECDDGNNAGGDGCSDTCTLEMGPID